MKALLKKLLLATLAGASVPGIYADATKAAPVKPPPARSVFALPTAPREGRDPFFPDSMRPYEANAAAQTPVANAFLVKGISYEHGRAMVIINNHTFALGDEGDVLTSTGRMHIRLVEIRRDVVMIEVNGALRALGLGNK